MIIKLFRVWWVVCACNAARPLYLEPNMFWISCEGLIIESVVFMFGLLFSSRCLFISDLEEIEEFNRGKRGVLRFLFDLFFVLPISEATRS
jgi:hypothetical protein